jgi:hypothetical protein
LRITSTAAVPRTATTRRRITARSGLLGNASASRHSIVASPVTQRLRQIKVPGS